MRSKNTYTCIFLSCFFLVFCYLFWISDHPAVRVTGSCESLYVGAENIFWDLWKRSR